MADEADNQITDAIMGTDSGGDKAKSGSLVWFILLGVVALAGVGGGLAAGMILSPRPAAAEGAEEAEPEPVPTASGSEDDYSYYEFESVTVNLNDPRLARYVRASVMLKMKTQDEKATSELIAKKLPELKNWFHVYLAGCTLDEVRGPKNLNRIRREIQDSFNEQLWPGGRPLIEEVLFKEFMVQ